ncbi:MAG: phosphoglucosamine mutase, partial [bacterium]
KLKISISGVRGVVGESLTPDLLVRFAEAFGTYLGRGASVVVGRDTRTSGEMVQHAVLAGLVSAGCRVTLLDICPVPTLQLAVRNLGADGGIEITASHNPVEWNALKFIREDGCFLNYYQARELLDIYHQGDFAKAYSGGMNRPRKYGRAVEDHIEAIIGTLGRLPKGRRPIRAVVDCVNGAGSVMSAELLRRLGCEVFTINDTPDGIFPRPPEPLPENLAALCDETRRLDADIGFAQDADADRLAIVSEKGLPIGEDYTLAIAVDYILSQTPGNVVVNLSTTRAVDDIAASHGCRVVKSKIGEINVVEMMKAENAVIGGEGNGGVIYPAINYARDSFAGMAIALHYIAARKKPVSALVAALPAYKTTKSAIPCPLNRAQEVVEFLIEKYKSKKLVLTDGVKIPFGKSWSLVRASNTEPILRIITEAASDSESRRLNAETAAAVRAFLGE